MGAVRVMAFCCSLHVQEMGGTAPPTQIAVRLTYVLNYWTASDWEQPTEENGRPSPPGLLGAATDPVE